MKKCLKYEFELYFFLIWILTYFDYHSPYLNFIFSYLF